MSARWSKKDDPRTICKLFSTLFNVFGQLSRCSGDIAAISWLTNGVDFTAARSRCRCKPRGGCRVTRSSPSWPSPPACLLSRLSAAEPPDSTGSVFVSRSPSSGACRSDRSFWWRHPDRRTASEDSPSSTSIERSGSASVASARCKRHSRRRRPPPSAETEARRSYDLWTDLLN